MRHSQDPRLPRMRDATIRAGWSTTSRARACRAGASVPLLRGDLLPPFTPALLVHRGRVPVWRRPHLAAKRSCLPRLSLVPVRHELRDRLAVAGYDDLLAGLHPLDELREVGLRLVDIHPFHGTPVDR